MARRVGLQKEERAGREHWSIDAGTADVAVLDVPASAQRDRVFDVSVHFIVRAPAPLAGAWHEMTVELNGQRQWSRRLNTHNPGETDTLDYHCRHEVPTGQSLRMRVTTRVQGAVRTRLTIEAEEAQA
jgi:hypothetical protein